MSRATTDVPLTVENRRLTITVRAPTPPTRLMLAAKLPSEMMDADEGDDLSNAFTLKEIHDHCVTLITALTDLPRSFVDQLPGGAIEKLANACAEVIEEDYRREQRRSRRFQQHMNGVPNNERVEAIFEFVEEDEGDLTDVSGVGEGKADILREAGYETLADLRAADQADLADVEGIGNALAARIKADVGSDEVEL